ncbi:MAG: hypothetical protein AB7V18_04120 [Pyrinomonadaceae bacterium]
MFDSAGLDNAGSGGQLSFNVSEIKAADAVRIGMGGGEVKE